jgi:hypothetical protein
MGNICRSLPYSVFKEKKIDVGWNSAPGQGRLGRVATTTIPAARPTPDPRCMRQNEATACLTKGRGKIPVMISRLMTDPGHGLGQPRAGSG